MRNKNGDGKTPVTIVHESGDSRLVEYIDANRILHRVYVPASKVIDGLVIDEVLNHGIPYGYPWGEVDLSFDGEKFEDLLHQNGIWTLDDVLKNPQKVSEAIHATMADKLSKILEIAKLEKKGVRQ